MHSFEEIQEKEATASERERLTPPPQPSARGDSPHSGESWRAQGRAGCCPREEALHVSAQLAGALLCLCPAMEGRHTVWGHTQCLYAALTKPHTRVTKQGTRTGLSPGKGSLLSAPLAHGQARPGSSMRPAGSLSIHSTCADATNPSQNHIRVGKVL